MKKFNSNRSFSNRRAIITGCNPVILYDKYKSYMKMLEVYQGLKNAQYQAKKRYIEHQTGPIPRFECSVMTEMVHFNQQQSTSEPVSSSYQTLLLGSSFKHLFEKISMQQDSAILKEVPKSPQDWYYATGGVMPYRK